MSKRSWFREHEGLHCPEILFAIGIVLVSPFWEVQLIRRGQLLAAIILPSGFVFCCCAFYQADRQNLSWLGYIAILGIIITAWATHKFGSDVVF
jgi:hypothetical protein